MNICLQHMNKDLAKQYFRNFTVDPALFMDGQEYQPFIYSDEKAEAIVDRHHRMGREYLAVMLNEEPIGEVVLKNIDRDAGTCTLGISLRSDEYKNRGYGTEAEIQALKYAFGELGMATVFADSILKNTRSQHVLEKVGFYETHRDDSFVYYRCDCKVWFERKA